MDEEWRLEGMVAHLEKTIIVLNLGISCGLPEIKCCVLTWLELCCLTSAELFFGNMIRFISLGIWAMPFHSVGLLLVKVEALVRLSYFWAVCVSRHPFPYLCLIIKNSSPSCIPDRCVWPFPWYWKILKLVCVYPQVNYPTVVKLSLVL